jgi:hypothetical protein
VDHMAPGLAELQQPGLAALVALAEKTASTQPLPIVEFYAPQRPGAPARCPGCGKAPRRRLRRPRWLTRRKMLTAALGAAVLTAGVLLMPVVGKPAQAPESVQLYDWKRPTDGITLSGFQNYLMGPPVMKMMIRQIGAAKYYWRANTIRLQILQDRLVGQNGNRYNRWYKYALHLHLTVVLNDQTEMSVGYARDEALPTKATYAFWARMMAVPHWRNNPRIILDLFNEPRRCSWGGWHDTHQGLINFLRDNGVRNELWVEGINWASTLEGMPLLHDPLWRPHMRVPSLVYTFHHPGAPKAYMVPHTSAVWDRAFGYLARRGYPVIDGEFTNYVGNYDWENNPTESVGTYLAYLRRLHIGMVAWSLVPGSLNQSMRFDSVTHEPQGDGAIVLHWFHQQWRARQQGHRSAAR